MSHFLVVVIGADPETALAPFHEFECTGEDNEYVINVDKTAEVRAEYATHTERRVKMADGTIRSYFNADGEYDPIFVRDVTPEEVAHYKATEVLFGFGSGSTKDGKHFTSGDRGDGRGYRTQFVELPEGATEIEVNTTDYKSFAEWIEGWYGHPIVPFGEQPDLAEKHKYGYTLVDAQGEVIKTIDRTNPSKKWDWWQVGGRWRGFFKVKPGAPAIVGEPGVFDNAARPGYADVVKKGHVDFAGMRKDAAQKAGESWDKVHAVLDLHPPLIPWDTIRDSGVDIQTARDLYHAQAGYIALNKTDLHIWEVDPYLVSREEYVDSAAANAATPFAVVYQGKWYERGRMGWWACVSDEKDENEWGLQVKALLDGVPEDTLLTACDLHI